MNRRNFAAASPAILGLPRLRVIVLFGVMLVAFGVIAVTLFMEQIQTGETHRSKILRQSVRRIRIPARRGSIFTRDQQLLAGNRPVYNLLFYPEEMRQRRLRLTVDYIMSAADRIAAATGRRHDLDRDQVLRHLNTRPGLPLEAFTDLTPAEIAKALECMRELRGTGIQVDSVRSYPGGPLAAHLIGYTRLDSPREAEDRADFFYYVPDQTGCSGVEKAFDTLPESLGLPETLPGLRGRPGYSLAQVDHLGFIHRHLIEKIEPIHGNNVILTIDSQAQRTAEALLAGRRGALVALDADTGDILAAASTPGFDLSRFSPRIPASYYKELLANPGRPLVNRAFSGVYTPGSIFKVLSAMAFYDAGVDPAATVRCDGSVTVGNAAIRCAAYRRGGHGEVNFVNALAWSCNSYMIENALKTGPDPIRQAAESAGIGRKTGVELSESAGVFPSDAAKRRRFGTRWNRYDTALLSMGQGIIALTPLQAALYCAAIANGGTMYRPHLVDSVVDGFGTTLYRRVPVETGRLAVSEAALEQVRRGMSDVVNTPEGSGRRAAVEGLTVYGKTGSAEVGSRENRRLTTWFIAFAAHRGRTVALAVAIEGGASGGADCAPIAGDFLRSYLLNGR